MLYCTACCTFVRWLHSYVQLLYCCYAYYVVLNRFRYVLTDNKKALTKFLLSVDWTVEAEVTFPSLVLLVYAER